MQKRIWIMCFTTAVLLFGFSTAEVTAQTVQGHVKVNFYGNRVDDEISVNALLG